MITGKVTSKGQITLPKEIRDALEIRAGDIVAYQVSGSKVILEKSRPIDHSWLALVEQTLDEWNSPEDEELFRDL